MNTLNQTPIRTLILIPTYNERGNVEPLIQEICSKAPSVDLLFIDDNSPDGTGELVESIARSNSRVHLLRRARKEGLGRAYLAGFAWGLEHNFDWMVEMDADFSHRPADLIRLLEVMGREAQLEFAVGSRYVTGGTTVNWGWVRKLISRGGSWYARQILGYPLHDWTGGFNAWKASALKKIGLEKVTSNGYSFQIELKYRALRVGCQGVEVPITFEERRVGQSKMSLRIVLEAFYRVWQIRSV